MPLEIAELLERVEEIPPLPEVAQQLLEMTGSDDFSAAEIGEKISQDAAISAKLFRIANSPLYSPGLPITEISRAVTLLGNAGVTSLVIGICASLAISPSLETERVHEFLWSHSLATGILAQELARRLRIRPAEEMFTAGMFSNLGYLAMASLLPGGHAERLFMEIAAGEVEPEVLDHLNAQCQELGLAVLHAWAVPGPLCEIASPLPKKGEATPKQQLLWLARDLIELKGWWFYSPSLAGQRSREHCAALGLSAAVLGESLQSLRLRFEQLAESLGCSGVLLHPPHSENRKTVLLVGECEGEVDLPRVLLQDAGYEVIHRGCDRPLPQAVAGDGDAVDVEWEAQAIVFAREAGGDLSARISWARDLIAKGARFVGLLGLADQTLRAEIPEGPGELYAMPAIPRGSDLQRAGLLAGPTLRGGTLRELLSARFQ